MLKTFKREETEKIFRGLGSRKWPQEIHRVAARTLEQLQAATMLDTLRGPPGHRLEALTDDRQGQQSLRVNEPWRECVVWRDGDADDAENVDSHGGEMMTTRDFPPMHPGEMLLEDCLQPMQISQYHVAQALGVPPRRLHEMVHGQRGMPADTARRLDRFVGMEAHFWMHLQTRDALEITRQALAARLDQEGQVPVA